MTAFRYTARDTHGNPLAGHIEASSIDEARDELRNRGLEVESISPGDVAAATERRIALLSLEETEQLTGHMARLSVASLPMAPGLRAAAEESTSRRVALALRWIADGIEQGRSLEDVLGATDSPLPRHIRGLVVAAIRTGSLGDAISQLEQHHRASRMLRQSVIAGLMYPLVVTVVAVIILSFILIYVAGVHQKMFDEFGLSLPQLTQLLFWWRDTGLWLIAGIVAFGVVVAVAIRCIAGRAAWSGVVATMPVVGPLVHWSAIAEWSGLMGVLIRYRVALPDALMLAADGVANAAMGRLSRLLAAKAAEGQSISRMVAEAGQLPNSLIPLVRWGEQTGTLSEAFDTSRELLQRRVQMRSMLLKSILPPLLFVGIGCAVIFVVMGIFLPLVSMISGLS